MASPRREKSVGWRHVSQEEADWSLQLCSIDCNRSSEFQLHELDRNYDRNAASVSQLYVKSRSTADSRNASSNWQDWGARWDNRTTFHAALIHYTKQCGITFTSSAQPVQYWQADVDEPASETDELEDLDDLRSPLSPAEGTNDIPAPLPPAQPLFGFLPPEGSRMRKRKGHSKERNMQGVGA